MTQLRRMFNFSRVARLIFIAALPTLFATCDLVQPPDADGPVDITFSSPFTLVAGRDFTPPVVVTQSGVIVAEPRIQLSSSDSDIVDVSGAKLIPLERGQVTIKARLLGSTLGSAPPEATLPVQVIAARVEAQLSALTMRSLSDTITLVAKAVAENGRVLARQDLGWTSSAPSVVSVDTLTGKLTTHTNGTALIVAEVDGRKDTVSLAVSQRLFTFTFQPAAVVFSSLGDTVTITATPRDSGGTPMGQPFQYQSSLGSVASVGLTGKLNALANGTTYIRAVSGTVVDSARVEVRQVAQQVLVTGPDTVTIEAINDTTQLVALAFDQRAGAVLNNKPVWQSRNLGVAVVDASTGLVRGLTVGSARIVAALENGSDSIVVVVSNDAERLVVTPDSVFITALQDIAQLTGVPQNRLNVPLSNIPVTWSALDAAVASVDPQGKVTGNAIGTTRVIGTAVGGTLADTATIVVVNLPDFIDILPVTKTLASIGDTVFPAVDFRNTRGAALNRGAVTWFSKDPVVASVSSSGVGQAVGPGTTYIVAFNPANQARRDSIEVIVTNAPVSLTLNRPPVGKTADTLTSPSKTLQYSADVRNGAGTLIPNLTINWRSTNTAIADVSPSGLVTAGGLGTVSIIAEVTGALGLKADTAVLVALNVPATLTLNPTTASISAVGGTQQLTATARNDLGNIISGLTFGFGTSNGAVAAVSGAGMVTAQGPGTATITATIPTLTGTLSATADISVVNPPDLVDILPTAVTLGSINDSTTPAVDFRTTLGSPLPRTAATWSSDDPSVAQVTSGGIVIAQGRGVTKVRAINPLNASRRDSIDVTVTNATVVVDLNRTDDTLTAPGRTLPYAATPFNARGNVVQNELITWVSRTPGVASVNAQGLATALTTGLTRIVALVGTVGDSAPLLVTNKAVSVELTPSPVFINTVGGTQQLTATARNDLGAIITSPVITWGTGNGAIATVSGTGLVSGTGIGSTTATAAVDGVTAVVTINVANDIVLVDILTPDTTLVSAGDTVTLGYDFRNSTGALLPRDVADWRSSDPNILTVSGTGVVIAKARGVAKVKAVSPDNVGVADSITITVADSVNTVVLSRGDTTLTAFGRTLAYTAAAFNANGLEIASQAITFVSRNTAVATTTPTGLATAVGLGTTRIVALAELVGDSSNLTVTNDAVSVEMTPARDTILDLGGTLQLTAIARNDLGGVVPGAVLTYTALQPTIGTVSASGLVTASAVNIGIDSIVVQAPGGIRDTTVILVANAPRTVAITSGPVTLASVSDQATPAANIRNLANGVLPRNSVTWTSSAPTVVAVNDIGVVTAVARGVATITATSPHDPTLNSSVTVTVTNAPVSVALNAGTVHLSALGRTFGMIAVVRNAAGNPVTDTSVTWSAGAASVDITASGIVTAVSVDTTFVTATVTGTAVSNTAVIQVTNLPVSVTAGLTAVTLTSLQDTVYLKASARNDLGGAILGVPALWRSSNTAIVGIGPNPGTAAEFTQADSVRIRAQGVGQATVRARIATGVGTDSVDVTIAVTVRNDPTTVDLTGPSAVTLANLGRTDTPAANIRDALNAVLARSAVLWTTTNPSVVTVSNLGVVAGVGNGTAKIAATSPSSALVTDTVTYTVEAPAYSITLNVSTDSLTALTQTRVYSAVVRDSLGNVLPAVGGSIAWTDVNNTGPKVTFTPTTGFTTTATAAAVTGATRVTVTATVTPATVLAGASLAASVDVGVGNDAASVAASPTSATITSVGGTASIAPTVRNSLGGVIAGAQVTWATSNAGVVTVPLVATTGAQNVTAAGVGTAVVTITAASGVQTTVFVTVAKVASATTSTVTVLPTAIIANGVATSTVTVQLKDAGGTNLTTGGDAVTLAIQAPALGTTIGPVTDNHNGTYTGTLTSGTTLGTVTVSGTVNTVTITDDATVDLIAGPAAILVITGSASQQAGDAQTVTLTAQDAQGHTAVGYTGDKSLTFSGAVSSPSGQSPTATNKLVADINFGVATVVTFTAGVGSSSVKLYGVETALVAVTDGSISAAGANRLSVSVSADDLENFAFALASPQTNGLAFTGTNTLTARDLYHNTVTTFDASADVVTISANGPLAGVVTGLGSGNNAILDQAGDFVSGVAVLTGDLVYTGLAQTGSFTATSGVTGKTGTSNGVTISAGAATQLAVSGSASQTAGTQQLITITAQDQSGNTATTYSGDQTLTFSGAADAASGDDPTVEDKNAAEVDFGDPATVTFTGGEASTEMRLVFVQTALINVDDGSLNATGNELSVAVAPAAVESFDLVLSSPQVINEVFTGTNTVTARDPYQNVVTGFDASLDNVTITGDAPLTGGIAVEGLGSGGFNVLDQSGDFTSGVADLSALGIRYRGIIGTGTFTATSATAKTGQSGAVVVTPGEAVQLQILGSPTQTAGTTQTITIRAFDAGANTATGYTGDHDLVFSGAPDAFTGQSPTVQDKTGTEVDFGDPTSITFALGTATRDMRLFRAGGPFLVSATDGANDAVDNELSVTVTADDASTAQSTVAASPLTGVLADGIDASTITVQLKDAFGNNTTTGVGSGVDATLSGGATNAAIGPFGTIGGGTYTASLTSTTFGDAIVNARINTTDITHGTNPRTVTFVASHLVITGGGTQTAGASQTVDIRARDADGNIDLNYDGDKPLVFSGATQALTGQNPSATNNVAAPVAFGASTTVTFVDGEAQSDITLYFAEIAVISVTDNVVSAVGGDALSVDVTADALDNFELVLADPQQDGVAFTSVNSLTARDQFNNTVKTFEADGENVTFTTAPAGGTVSGLSGGDVLNAAADFDQGVADLTVLGITYTGAPTGSVTFTATSGTAKTGVATITIDP